MLPRAFIFVKQKLLTQFVYFVLFLSDPEINDMAEPQDGVKHIIISESLCSPIPCSPLNLIWHQFVLTVTSSDSCQQIAQNKTCNTFEPVPSPLGLDSRTMKVNRVSLLR